MTLKTPEDFRTFLTERLSRNDLNSLYETKCFEKETERFGDGTKHFNPLCAVTQHVGFDVTDASVRQPNMLGLGAAEALQPFINVLGICCLIFCLNRTLNIKYTS